MDNTSSSLVDAIPKIRVVVRKRPLGSKEVAKKENDIVDVQDMNTVVVKELRYPMSDKNES